MTASAHPSPAAVIDLSAWKITLPTGKENSPTEVTGAALQALSIPVTFWVGDDGAVHFRAPVNGVTTSHSGNPRSELREMQPGGSKVAKWSAKSGYHRLSWDEAFVRLPNPRTDSGNAGVVGAQIHDDSNDITVFRCEATGLYVTKGNDTHYKLVDPHYVMGTRYRGRFEVDGGSIRAYYNDALVATIPCKSTSLYFKAGCYTQANSTNSAPNDASNYGETAVWAVTVEHSTKQLPPVVAPPPGPPADPPPSGPPTQDPPPVVTPPVVTPPPAGGDITVMIARHGEKPDSRHPGFTDITFSKQDSHSLTANGWVRARDLPTDVFGVGPGAKPIRAGLVLPDVIYAADGPNAGERMKETVSFLAPALGLTPVLRFDKGQGAALAAELKTLVGHAPFVSWEHSEIPAVAKALGPVSPAPPSSWPDDRFDVIWVFRSKDGGKTWAFSQVLEAIGLPGEKTTVIG